MVARVVEFSTRSVADGARSRQWEDWNRSALIGLRCETPGGRGLQGTERTLHLPELTVGLVSTDAHVVRRDVRAVATSPSDSIVVYAILQGRSVFSDRHGERTLVPGDALVAHSDEPFERALPTQFRELVLKMPRQLVDGIDGPRTGSREPRRLSGLAATRLRALQYCVAGTARGVDDARIAPVTRVGTDLLADLTVDSGHGDRASLADLLVEQQLHSPSLTAAWLADRLHVSARHLSRMFAESGTTFPKHVTARRLARAGAMLRHQPERSVADVARSCGFASAAYFSRAFSAAVGESPARFRGTGTALPDLAPGLLTGL